MVLMSKKIGKQKLAVTFTDGSRKVQKRYRGNR